VKIRIDENGSVIGLQTELLPQYVFLENDY
jgi:hypothetical protein